VALRIGIVASAGGSVFAEMHRAAAGLPVEWRLVTDRACGAEEVARAAGVPAVRVVEAAPDAFSAGAATWLEAEGVDLVFLHFARVVTPALHAKIPTFNVHPSLLPAFPGFGAVPAARAAGVRVLGSTVHLATAAVDAGPIVVQAWSPADPDLPLERWEASAFLLKLRACLVLLELALRGQLRVDLASASATLVAPPPADSWSNPGLVERRLATHIEGLRAP
jgi:phosphoribosylglycinamide formyltransferase-1